MRRGLGPSGVDTVFEPAHDCRIHYGVKVLYSAFRIDDYAIAAAVSVVGGMQRLMNVADKVDEERQVAGAAEAVVVRVFQTLRVLLDFSSDAVAAGASRGNVGAPVLQA